MPTDSRLIDFDAAAPLEARVVSQTVALSADRAYDFARRMENLPQWASGLATGVQSVDGEWFTESPMGRVKVVMAAQNEWGVLDHDVTLPDGRTVHNAFRVTPAGGGCVFSFVLLRLMDVGQAAFDADVAHVQRDLWALKQRLDAQT